MPQKNHPRYRKAEEEIARELKKRLSGNIVILGVGNDLRGDDGFGSILARRLKLKLKIPVFDAATAPENWLGPIADSHPDTVLIFDACDWGGEPGELRVLGQDEISGRGFTTHDASPTLLMQWLKENCANVKVFMVAVQPESTGFGEPVSEKVKESLDSLENLVHTCLKVRS